MISLLFFTAVTLSQINCPGSSGAPTVPMVLVATPVQYGSKLSLTCAVIDKGTLLLDTTTTPPTLRGLVAITPVQVLPVFVDGEIPAGAVDGTNAAYTLMFTPTSGSLLLFRNGLLQQIAGDYTLTGNVVTFNAPPQAGDTLQASYRH